LSEYICAILLLPKKVYIIDITKTKLRDRGIWAGWVGVVLEKRDFLPITFHSTIQAI